MERPEGKSIHVRLPYLILFPSSDHTRQREEHLCGPSIRISPRSSIRRKINVVQDPQRQKKYWEADTTGSSVLFDVRQSGIFDACGIVPVDTNAGRLRWCTTIDYFLSSLQPSGTALVDE
jgi:hypothetical protein